LAGQGGSGSGGGDAGDLFLRVNILPDSRFTMNGHDLATTVDITPWEAALGAKIPVPTIDGRINLTVPAVPRAARPYGSGARECRSAWAATETCW